MMLLGRQVFKNYGWETAAKATPVVLLVTGVSLGSTAWHKGMVEVFRGETTWVPHKKCAPQCS